MAGFKVEKQTAGSVAIDDLGITLTGAIGTIVDLTDLNPSDIARSADLLAAIPASILVVDPRDDTDATILTSADSTDAVQRANDTHFGISGGRFASLDDPTVAITDDFILQYDSGSDSFESVDPVTFLSSQNEAIEDIVGGMGVNGTDTTFTYNDGAGTVQWDVDDVFLRNTGDTLDSGTLTIAEGATLLISADGGGGGATFTIGQDATATIATPSGGFSGATSIVNKEYVDSVAAGFDPKESVRLATTADLDTETGDTWTAAGSGVGKTLTSDANTATIDGVAVVNGDRILVKDQATAADNGIYVVSGVGGAAVVLTRAEDFDGSPANEVSGGAFTFVEDVGTVNSNTGWVVVADGNIVVDTDDIDWTQFTGTGAIVAGIGISLSGNTIDLDVDNLTTASAALSDTLAFHDADGVAEPSGSQSRKSTFTSLYNDHDVVYGITSNGIITRTAEDVYTSVSIVVDGAGPLDGLAITNGDGVSGNPTIGLDIQNLTLRAAVDGVNDRVAVWDSSANANVYYTVNDIAGAASASNSFETWSGAGNTTGDASIVADSATDTVTVTGGIGINVDLNAASDIISWSFTRAGMADTAVVGGDTIAFFDASNANEPEFRSFTDLISDLSLISNAYTTIGGDTGTATATGSDTLNLVGETNGGITTDATEPGTDQVAFSITPIDLVTGAATLATGDFIIVSDSADTAATIAQKYTFQDVIDDLNLTVSGVTDAFGLVTGGDGGTATAIGTDTITVNGTGINITATNGGAGADTLDLVLDIGDLAAGAGTVDAADGVAVNDGGTTVQYLWSDVITDLGLQTTGYTTIGGDTGTTTAAASDTLNLIGGTNGGITTTASEPGTDQVTFDITPIDLVTGAATLALGDFIIVSDSTDTAATVAQKYTFTDIVQDLDIPNAITANGFVVRTAEDTYASRTITASADEDELGIAITNGDGVAADPTIGLDILGLTDPDDDMDATDEFAVHDKSEGTAGANRKMTGQNIADGTAAILGIESLTFATFPAVTSPAEDQTLLAFTDATRSKTLSVETHTFQWAENTVGNNDWIQIGNASDADSGWVMPFDGTIVGMTAYCEDAGGATFDIDLYINGADNGAVAVLTGTDVSDTDPTLDIDFSAGDKLRLRGDRTAGGGSLGDTNVALLVKWRA